MKTVLFSLSMIFLASCANDMQKDQGNSAMNSNGTQQQSMQQRKGNCDGSCCPHKCTRPKNCCQ